MNEPQTQNFSQSPSERISPPSDFLDFWHFAVKQTAATGEAFFIHPQSAWQNTLLGIFLVSVPVFFEAPLVRLMPWVSLLLSAVWFWGSDRLAQRPQTAFIGDLLFGFSWSWLAGAIYWGWFRWEPLWHLPVESIGLPIAIWGLCYGRSKVGHSFYLGSLLGTAITDFFFYWLNLMPTWRQLMAASPTQAIDIIQQGFAQVQTAEGVFAAALCAIVLLVIAGGGWYASRRHYWVFSGTLIGTLLVDSLFIALARL